MKLEKSFQENRDIDASVPSVNDTRCEVVRGVLFKDDESQELEMTTCNTDR